MKGVVPIGDPTVAGLVTVVAYAVAAFVCAKAAVHEAAGHRRFWTVLAVVLACLGVNKQLDLQSLLTDAARVLAQRQGWYGWRRPVQAIFVAGVAAGGLLLLSLAIRRGRGTGPGVGLALCGIVLLFCFVTMRAATFHHADRLIGLRLGGVRLNALLELGGIILTMSGALRARRSRRSVATDAPS